MKLNLLAMAAAMFALTAAAAQASPATVLPDTGHAIVRGTKTIVGGTVHGVGHQVGNVGYIARSTTHSVVHGTRRAFRGGRHHHHHYHRVVTHNP